MNVFEQLKLGDEIVIKLHNKYIVETVVKITSRTIKTTGNYIFNRRDGELWGSDTWGTHTCIAGNYRELMTADEAKKRNAAESERIKKAKLAKLIINSYRKLMTLPVEKLQQAVEILELRESEE